MLSDAMVHRFFKDFNISLPVERSEFLNYYVETFNEYFDLKRKLEAFTQARNDFDNDEAFYVYRNGIVEKILSYIQGHKKYKEFNESIDKFDEGLLTGKLRKNKDIFTKDNVGKTFLSVDLTSGNFTALKHWDRDLVMNAETWEEFVSNFTKYKYFAEAKHFRQALLGKLNPKRIMRYERFLLERDILSFIISDDRNSLKLDDIINHNYDEIIFEVDSNFNEHLVRVPDTYKNDVHIELFTLEDVAPYKMFVKHSGAKIKFKCVSSNLFPQVYKHVMRLPLHSKDMYFIADTGQMAKYMEALTFE